MNPETSSFFGAAFQLPDFPYRSLGQARTADLYIISVAL